MQEISNGITDGDPDLMTSILRAMLKAGLAPLPRNYRIFYEARLGLNPELATAFAALGPRPSQPQLDRLDHQYPAHQASRKVSTVNKRLLATIEAIIDVVQREERSLREFNAVMGEAKQRLDPRRDSRDSLLRSVEALGSKTATAVAGTRRAVEDVTLTSVELAEAYAELEDYKQLATTDALTDLQNRRAFDEKMAMLYDHHLGLPLTALMIIDIDHFKRINDIFGHPLGDKVLAALGTTFKHLLKASSFFVARIGGEEFAVIVEGYTKDEVVRLAQRIRVIVRRQRLRNAELSLDIGSVTVSIGVAMAKSVSCPEELYKAADAALYAAKEGGRDNVVLYENDLHRGIHRNTWLIYR